MYTDGTGTVEAIRLASESGGERRRNVTAGGAALNHLVGERFRVGDGIEVEEAATPSEPLERIYRTSFPNQLRWSATHR